MKQLLPPLSVNQSIFICGTISASLYGGALFFQYVAGLTPCSLCLWQRWPHMIIILLAALAPFVHMTRFLLTAIAITAGVSVVLASFHAGVEWKFWAGPDGCAANLSASSNLSTITERLLTTPVVRCDEVSWSFLGLSMAAWNSLLSFDICILALVGIIKGRKEAL